MTSTRAPEPAGRWRPGMPTLLGAVRDVDVLQLRRTATVVATGRRGDPYMVRFDPTVDHQSAHYLLAALVTVLFRAATTCPFVFR